MNDELVYCEHCEAHRQYIRSQITENSLTYDVIICSYCEAVLVKALNKPVRVADPVYTVEFAGVYSVAKDGHVILTMADPDDEAAANEIVAMLNLSTEIILRVEWCGCSTLRKQALHYVLINCCNNCGKPRRRL